MWVYASTPSELGRLMKDMDEQLSGGGFRGF
jgi:hypothetical protein